MSCPYPPALALSRLLLIGVAAWFACTVAVIAWFFATADDAGLMAVALPFYAWGMAFLPGGLIMALYGTARVLTGRSTFSLLMVAIAVYFLPMLAATAVSYLFGAVQPTAVRQGDLPMMVAAFAGPLYFLLYLIGALAGHFRREGSVRRVAVTIAAAPVAGVLLQITLFAAFTLTSPQWRNRDAVSLEIDSLTWRDPAGLAVDARLLPREDKEVVMHAFYRDRTPRGGRGEPVRALTLEGTDYAGQSWTRTPVMLQAGESYRLGLSWNTLRTTSLNSDREIVLRLVEAPDYHSGKLFREFLIDADPDPATLSALEARLKPVSREGRMGYANQAGKIIIEPRFDWADEFQEGLARVRVGGKFGFIDDGGRTVIPIRYDDATEFRDGLAGVRLGMKAGYIDPDGQTVIPFLFDHVRAFSEGLAQVGVDGKAGFIDRSGELAIQPRWERAHDFFRGLAAVRVGEKWGFIDRSGELVIEPKFRALRCCSNARWDVLLDRRWGYIDDEGRLVFD